MKTPEQNYEIIKAVLDTDKNLFIIAVRNKQSVSGRSGILRTSDDPNLQAMIDFVDTMDKKFLPREKIADILKNNFSPEQFENLTRQPLEELDAHIKSFIHEPSRRG